ncbi:hypothetical protein M5G27_24515 [Pseudomonas shahriarae]|uniref:Uncharacterized protein n=1 Tax=Pseudomonas shahriarae TaxID=2745512 RepID=A0A9X4C5L5_9PSED|nr:hypothetical protein [Pseudomonas shahriarae]MDD1010642.1 hypothetical protein [Pseudomonas shahriarae]
MNADWNWFFSSLSQSAAAIVGIFGAFIITKIFANQTAFSEKKSKLKNYLIEAEKISDDANSYNMEWHNKHFNHPEYRKFHDFLDQNFPATESIDDISDQTFEDFIHENSFSQYSDKEDIKKELVYIATKIFEANASTREAQEASDRAAELLKESPLGKIMGITQTIAGVRNYNDFLNGNQKPLYATYGPIYKTNWDDVTKERESLEKSYLAAKHHARLATDLLRATEGDPESPFQISAALALVLCIFFIGVIYPLSFMPAVRAPEISIELETILGHILSFKGALLGVISTAFTVIVAIFYTTHSGMKYSRNDLDELTKITNAKSYCSFFKYVKDDEL